MGAIAEGKGLGGLAAAEKVLLGLGGGELERLEARSLVLHTMKESKERIEERD